MMPRIVSLIVLAVLISCLGLAFIQVVQPFFLPLALAAVVSLLCQPLFRYFLTKTRGRRAWAAAFTSTAILTGVMLPVLICTVMAGWQLYNWSSDLFRSEQSRQTAARLYEELKVRKIVERLQPYLAEDSNPAELEQQITRNIQDNVPNVLRAVAERTLGFASSTFGMVGTLIGISVALGMFVTALYFFLADGPLLLAAAQDLLPLPKQHQDRLLNQFVRVTRAVVVGTFASALAQGLALGIGLYCVGIDNVILLTILATLVAIVPMTGIWFVWIPCAAWIALTRDSSMTTVTLFAAYNLLIVGSLDNLIRAYVLNSDVKLHPLLAFISVLGGLQWIGLWGVFVGPVIASCLHALIEIFNKELLAYGHQTQPKLPDLNPVAVNVTVVETTPVTQTSVDVPKDVAVTVVTSVNQGPAKPALGLPAPKRRGKRR
jgi:predicted PurR-regulated permease PerM